ncbi:MAG: hypothetical protein F7C35_03350 [Desulfurococcales archaeon]|nr:hypothetical protein [Desulfurococcales archaeon]
MGVGRVIEWIRRKGLKWRLIKADIPTNRVSDAARFLRVHRSRIVKTIIVTDGEKYYAAIIPGNRKLDVGKTSKLLGRRVRLATKEEVLEATGYPAGGVPPVALPSGITVIMDKRLLDKDVVYGGGGGEDYLLEFNPRELVEEVKPLVADISKK